MCRLQEDPLPPGDPLAGEYAALVAEVAAAFHAAIPGSQVSVDVPWSPYGIDGRYYDWSGLAGAADLLFVMMYDTQSQVRGERERVVGKVAKGGEEGISCIEAVGAPCRSAACC